MKKLFVIATCIIAASFLFFSCQKGESEQEQTSVKTLVEEESAQQAPAQPLQYEDKEDDKNLTAEDEQDDEDADNGDDNSLTDVQNDLQDIIDENPGTEAATRMQEVIIKLFAADLKRAAGQNGEAVSELQAAIGVLESAITDGLLDSAEGQGLIDELTENIEELNANL